MPALDFTEIPSARPSTKAPNEQDIFELFARDVLEHIGFKIISPPNRGPDLGKDTIIEETRRGVGGETIIKWLVSCKHYAHNGKSVSPTDELNILDRVRANKCHGFLGFYSTLPSTGLVSLLEGLDIGNQIYDHERIERTLLSSSEGLGSSEGVAIAKRFFPQSIKQYESNSSHPADVMISSEPLCCAHTGENLLLPKARGLIAFVRAYRSTKHTHYEDIYWCLKGEPDRILQAHYREQGLVTAWEDIPDIIMPTVYLYWCISSLNQLRDGSVTYSDQAFEKFKQFMIAVFPYVSRHMRNEERARVNALRMIPSWVGGLG